MPRRMPRTWLWWAGGAASRSCSIAGIAQWNLSQVGHVVNGGVTVLEVLHREVIVVPALAIDPIVGGDHVVRIERGNDVVDYILLRKSQLTGVHSVYIEPQSRIVHILRNVDLADTMHFANAIGQSLRDAIDLGQVRAAHLHIDGSWRTRIQNGVVHRAAGKECANVGKLAGHCLLHPVHIFEAAEPVWLV